VRMQLRGAGLAIRVWAGCVEEVWSVVGGDGR
jgi:hypothetical protein